MRLLKYFVALASIVIPATSSLASDLFKTDEMTFVLTYENHKDQIFEIPNLRCLYAGEDDVRCVGKVMSVSGITFSWEDAQHFLEKNCDTFPKMATSPKCVFTVRFTIGTIVQKSDAKGMLFTMVKHKDPMRLGLGADSKYLQ